MMFSDDVLDRFRKGGKLTATNDPPSDDLFRDSLGRVHGERQTDVKSREAYGRWVPGGDNALVLEEIAAAYREGKYDFDTAVRLTEAIKDAAGNHVATKRDLLMVLSREREGHYA